MGDVTNPREKVFWLQGWEGRVVQGSVYRSDIAGKIKLEETHMNGNVVGIKLYPKSTGNNYTVQFIINTNDQAATNYENKEEMVKQFKKHTNTEFDEGKLFVDPRMKEIQDEL